MQKRLEHPADRIGRSAFHRQQASPFGRRQPVIVAMATQASEALPTIRPTERRARLVLPLEILSLLPRPHQLMEHPEGA